VRILTAGTLPGEVESLLVIQSQWRNAGIEMVIEPVESGALFARLTGEARRHTEDPTHVPGYQAWTAGEGIRTGEIGYITERPKCDQGERGWERYCDPAFDAGFDLSQSPVSLEARLEGYAVINQGFRESAIRLPVFVARSNKALARRVQGFVPNPNDALDLRGVRVGG
jgi:ABC-type transport system substrate-binding protein